MHVMIYMNQSSIIHIQSFHFMTEKKREKAFRKYAYEFLTSKI
jgi:hypothetical protein